MFVTEVLGVSNVWTAWAVAVTWQLAALAAVAWLCEKVFRLRQPRARYALWWCVLVGPLLLGPGRIALQRGDALVRVAALEAVVRVVNVTAPAAEPGAHVGTAAPRVTDHSGVPAAPRWRDISLADGLAAVWLLGCVCLGVRLVAGHLRVRRAIEDSQPVADESVLRALQEMLAQAGVKHDVALRTSPSVGAPVLSGLRRPTVLLPSDWLDSISAADLRSLLAHEVAHVSRRDFLANFLQRLVEIPLFFHPFAWLASRRIALAREELADAWALSNGVDADTYARSLTAAAERVRRPVGLASVGVVEGKSTLLRRVEAIVRGASLTRMSRPMLVALICTVLISAVAFAAVEVREEPEHVAPVASSKVAVQTESVTGTGMSAPSVAFQEQVIPDHARTWGYGYTAPFAHEISLSLDSYAGGKRTKYDEAVQLADPGRHTITIRVDDRGKRDIRFWLFFDGTPVAEFICPIKSSRQRTFSDKPFPSMNILEGEPIPIWLLALCVNDPRARRMPSADSPADIYVAKCDYAFFVTAKVTKHARTVAWGPDITYDVVDLRHLDATYVAWLFGKAELPSGFFLSSGSPEVGGSLPASNGGGRLAGSLTDLLPDGITMLAPAAPGSRQLVVAGTPQAIAELQELISMIDRKSQQVVLECQYFPGLPAGVGESELRQAQGDEHGILVLPWESDWGEVRPPAGVETSSHRFTTMDLTPVVVAIPAAVGQGQSLLAATSRVNGDGSVTLSVDVCEMEGNEPEGDRETLTATTRQTKTTVNVGDGEAFGLVIWTGGEWKTVIVTPRIAREGTLER